MKRFISIIAAGVLLALTAADATAASRKSKNEFAQNLHTFNSIVKLLHTEYVDTLDSRKVMREAISALLRQADPFTEYFPVDEQDALLSISSGQYAGIGSVIMSRNGRILIEQPQWDSPSRKAGLKAGDVILTVDGDTVSSGASVQDVSKRLRGQAGTEVVVGVRRPYVSDSLLSFRIVRDDIKVEPVPYYGVDSSGVGYISLTTFNESSARRVKEALAEMQKNPRFKGLVLDLRDNGGGLLESAVQIAGLFVPKGTEIVRTRGRDDKMMKIYKTTHKPVAPDLPLAILIDEGTASSSEIVSGALQDLDRAVVIGERSYGKGLVQNTRPLPFGDILKITTARYYIPSGRLIQAIDYSHRDAEGRVTRIPDSLTTEFRTAAGRIVRDGGGITPDVKYTPKEPARIVYAIAMSNSVFDYATKFVAATDSVAAPLDFRIDESMLADFKNSIDADKLQYDEYYRTGIKYMREAAERDGYMTDSLSARFDALEAGLRSDFSRDFDKNRDEIEQLLINEILPRYYAPAEYMKLTPVHDEEVRLAAEILLDPERYAKLLSPEK